MATISRQSMLAMRLVSQFHSPVTAREWLSVRQTRVGLKDT